MGFVLGFSVSRGSRRVTVVRLERPIGVACGGMDEKVWRTGRNDEQVDGGKVEGAGVPF